MRTIDARAASALGAFLCEPAKGDVLGDRFTLREVIGEGGMGLVFAARDAETGEEVAVKVLHSANLARFSREVRALEALAHPAIVRHVTSGVHEGLPYIAMERLRGSTLAARLTDGPLDDAASLLVGRRIAEALSCAERAGIVHRDVKPSNIFLEDGAPARATLLDFGVARPVDAETLTRRGALVGTPGYMAPEQIRGTGETRPSADVFALGCVLFECLTGRAPFVADETHNALARILLEQAPLLRTVRAEVPLALEGLIEQMLDKDESRRPSARDVARELEAIERCVSSAPLAANQASAASAEGPKLEPGTIVDEKYRLERRIGEGGMGVIFAARHLDLGKVVALKFLRSFDPSSAARFLREAQAASHIESEHVARVLDVGRARDRAPYIVMEYLEGVDLAAHLDARGPLDVDDALAYVLQACEALAEAHRLGIVHRDLKPSNLFLVTRHGKPFVKVLDFGISKVTLPLAGRPVSGTTKPSGVFGSIAYMSPEQVRNAAHVDPRSDVWSLGVVLYELIAGRRPFEASSAEAIAARIAADAPSPLVDPKGTVPAWVAKAVSRCLEKSPENRPNSVDELALMLRGGSVDEAGSPGEARAAEAHVSSESATHMPIAKRSSGRSSRSQVVWALALACGAGVGAAAWFYADCTHAPNALATVAAAPSTARAAPMEPRVAEATTRGAEDATAGNAGNAVNPGSTAVPARDLASAAHPVLSPRGPSGPRATNGPSSPPVANTHPSATAQRASTRAPARTLAADASADVGHEPVDAGPPVEPRARPSELDLRNPALLER